MERGPGRRFRLLWAAFATSAAGTWLAFDAFPLIAILVLHTGPVEVSLLAAAGPAAGAVLATLTGPFVAVRRPRPVMIGADLVRFAALATVPVAYLLGWLAVPQLLLVAVVVAAADIAFTAASGAFLKTVVAPGDLLVANGRFESTTWVATAVGPPLGGFAVGVLGPVTTVVANAVSFLASAAWVRRIGPVAREPTIAAPKVRPRDLVDGWRVLLAHPVLRPLLLNVVAVNSLIMATAPLAAVLMLGELGFAPWQYALAFGAPCVGGLVGARMSRRLVERFGEPAVLRVGGTLRAVWSGVIAFVPAGPWGIVLVIAVQFCLVGCAGLFNPVLATTRLRLLPDESVVRALTAWSVSTKAAIAAVTALGGLLAAVTGPRVAIAAAGVLLLATPVLLPRRVRVADS
ncbi:MFS transporter [Pseudonocardia sulfidoxydans NBRC 16205]|uniref:MFS transporter n=1 Tax=Pseudonocardia sulfidoxydans NBRC 16205 TaxID=1223511 RepID=A0A511DFR7_9PSEU|nr:MFS transporter [Pseudonocardia sulfidoxydans]GEL23622.1 MFS transporter [Pseudonocardia sulfidoxydans NBRC 16205]